ncbi:MAG TPA: FecR domain-containing protein [Mucilaginibacter sp.]|jgi:transmembrane sensor|nr:FecR domain-containing protein [Mucilaginibacter sp.]
MQQKDIEELVKKYHAGQCTAEETAFLESWYAQWNQKIPLPLSPEELAEDLQIISANVQPLHQPARRIALWPRIAAAASIILCLSVGGYFILHKKPTQQTAQNQTHDIAPGSNKAILKMANGKQYSVTDAKNGLLAQQGNTTITKTADGKLVYNTIGAANSAILYDTLIVPRGGQHQVKFADGTIAYLNADTKLRIPENFEGSNRTVELITGEADFHVVHNTQKPFTVIAKGQITKDIGTEFNINAYPDESSIKTTLLEGSISVTKNNKSSILRPGQQAVVVQSTSGIRIQEVDTDEAFAWKNGKFLFSSTPLENIMRQVSRWYDVDVVYQSNTLKSKPFSAISTRFATASQVLHNLELTGDVKFKIDGKRIMVLNK